VLIPAARHTKRRDDDRIGTGYVPLGLIDAADVPADHEVTTR
jgi:hypothetical protein